MELECETVGAGRGVEERPARSLLWLSLSEGESAFSSVMCSWWVTVALLTGPGCGEVGREPAEESLLDELDDMVSYGCMYSIILMWWFKG